jgi:hypothetical protein
MWTKTTRLQHDRRHLRYGSDLTDAEWQLPMPLLPPTASIGRPRQWPMREMINALFYVMRSGCPWRMLPDCFAYESLGQYLIDNFAVADTRYR